MFISRLWDFSFKWRPKLIFLSKFAFGRRFNYKFEQYSKGKNLSSMATKSVWNNGQNLKFEFERQEIERFRHLINALKLKNSSFSPLAQNLLIFENPQPPKTLIKTKTKKSTEKPTNESTKSKKNHLVSKARWIKPQIVVRKIIAQFWFVRQREKNCNSHIKMIKYSHIGKFNLMFPSCWWCGIFKQKHFLKCLFIVIIKC